MFSKSGMTDEHFSKEFRDKILDAVKDLTKKGENLEASQLFDKYLTHHEEDENNK